MKITAIRTTIVLCLTFSHGIFAFTSGWCQNANPHTHENVSEFKYTNKKGMTRIDKHIIFTYHEGEHNIEVNQEGRPNERIVTIHDSIGNLLFFKHYKWVGNMLVQTIDDSIVRNIIPGRTHCEFTVIEPSGDSIYINLLDQKKEINMLIRDKDDFQDFLYGRYIFRNNIRPTRLDSIRFKRTPLDAIIYQWFHFCHLGKEEMEFIEFSSDSVSVNLASEKKYVLSYKYYMIVIIGIVVVCVIIIYKNRKKKRVG